MINIIVNNSTCQIQKISPKAEEGLKKILTYIDSAKDFSYQKNLKKISRLNSLLDNKKLTMDKAAIQKELNSALYLNRKLQAERKVCLYKHAKFPTGLLPKVLSYFKENKIEFELNDKRIQPKRNSVKLLPKESIPPLRYYQKDAIKALLDAGGRGIIVSPTGCHAKGSEIIMYDGSFKRVEDVKIGDQLMGPDSSPRTVLKLYNGFQEMVKIIPVKGEPWIVNLDHILSLKRTNDGKSNKAGEIINISVRDYLKTSKTFKHLHKLYRVAVDFSSEVSSFEIDPRVLGIWLGDGSSASATFTLSDNILIEELKQFCKKQNLEYYLKNGKGCISFVIISKDRKNTFTRKLKKLNILNNKHIPKEYLTSSRETRLQLLSGLLDTDGHKNSTGGFEITTKFPQLKEDILFLARSLGFAAYSTDKYVKLKTWKESKLYYRIIISGFTNIIPTKVKFDQPRRQIKSVLVTGFKTELLPKNSYYGFELDKDHLYLMKDFTVTHNTGKTIMAVKMVWELGVKCLIITPNKGITDLMQDDMIKYFGKGKVAKLNTKSKITKEINICNIQALIKIAPSVLKDIDAVIIDEFHHAAATTYQEVNLKHLSNCYYRIGLTATNFRNDGSDLALESVLSQTVYEFTIEKAIKEGFLVPVEFRMVENENKVEGKYQAQYKEGIVDNKKRNTEIAEIVSNHSEDSVIVLVQQIEHGEALKKLIPNSVFLNGKEKDTIRTKAMEDFRSGKLKILIGTSVIGEGVDLPIANVLVMAGGGKARSQVIQNVGRVLRLYKNKKKAIVYDFTDTGSKYLEKHSLLREDIYNMYPECEQ